MNINLGCSDKRIPGFTNLDIVPGDQVDIIGSATNIPVEDSSVSVLYSNAVLEHLFAAQVGSAFREFNRVLKPDGILIGLGIPDFSVVAKLYLDEQSPGICGDRFDLFNVYRYTHGHPEQCSEIVSWDSWDVGSHPYSAPKGYLGQLHKTLYDSNVLNNYLITAGFKSIIFNYCFANELYPISLGFIASKCGFNIPNPEEYLFNYSIIDTIAKCAPGEETNITSPKLALIKYRHDQLNQV